MQLFDPSKLTGAGLIHFIQSPALIKWIFLLLLISYTIYSLVVLRQIKSMEEVITQPISSTIVTFISLLFIAVGILLIIIVGGTMV